MHHSASMSWWASCPLCHTYNHMFVQQSVVYLLCICQEVCVGVFYYVPSHFWICSWSMALKCMNLLNSWICDFSIMDFLQNWWISESVYIFTNMQLIAYKMAIDLIHKSQNAIVPYPTMHQSEQKCAHFCSECSIVGYRTGAVCDLWIRSIAQVEHRPYSEFMRAWHWI